LPAEVSELTLDKLALFQANENHPSLRIKKIKGTRDIWEMSVSMNYCLTFQIDQERITLRRIGTHDILRDP
jgi:mRNA-degrading endonuclease YafQ of YafQ-DinJ toxin-antitoxin module